MNTTLPYRPSLISVMQNMSIRKFILLNQQMFSHKLLFLIHGAPGAWFGYKDYLNDSLLLQKFKIVAADRFGYNRSDRKLATIDEQAKAFYELLKSILTTK
jgi:pimeloyl-ACP methyl ester carboxylesterase